MTSRSKGEKCSVVTTDVLYITKDDIALEALDITTWRGFG